MGKSRTREWRGIQFSEEVVSEISGAEIVASVPRKIIDRIILGHGHQVQHPILQAVFGVILACAAIAIPTYEYFQAMKGGWLLLLAPVFFLVVAIVGLNLAYQALRRGYFLQIQFEGGSRKLKFRGRARIEGIETFLKSVHETFGYVVEREGATSGFPVGQQQNSPHQGH